MPDFREGFDGEGKSERSSASDEEDPDDENDKRQQDNFELLRNHRKKFGLNAASNLIARQSKLIQFQYEEMKESNAKESQMALKRSESRRKSIIFKN